MYHLILMSYDCLTMISSEVYTDDIVDLIVSLYSKLRMPHRIVSVFKGDCILFDTENECMTAKQLLFECDENCKIGYMFNYSDEETGVRAEIERLRLLLNQDKK